MEAVRRELAANPSLIESKDDRGYTPLQLAVMVGDPDVVRMLIELGANFNVKNWNHAPLEDMASGPHKEEIVGCINTARRAWEASRPSEPPTISAGVRHSSRSDENARSRYWMLSTLQPILNVLAVIVIIAHAVSGIFTFFGYSILVPTGRAYSGMVVMAALSTCLMGLIYGAILFGAAEAIGLLFEMDKKIDRTMLLLAASKGNQPVSSEDQ